MTRINKKIVDLDEKKVADFFEDRASKYNQEFPYSSILYQDSNPEIAKQRDEYEKNLVAPLLGVSRSSNILDIGCGVGRWAEVYRDLAGSYTGIDISEKLVELARNRIPERNFRFFVGPAHEIGHPQIVERGPFDVVIMSGIMIYLNDAALQACLEALSRIVAQGGCVYLREPIALVDRLTLSEFWSDELNQHYSAIYRTEAELEDLFSVTLYPAGFDQVRFKKLYEDQRLNNRRETSQHYAIVHRGTK